MVKWFLPGDLSSPHESSPKGLFCPTFAHRNEKQIRQKEPVRAYVGIPDGITLSLMGEKVGFSPGEGHRRYGPRHW